MCGRVRTRVKEIFYVHACVKCKIIFHINAVLVGKTIITPGCYNLGSWLIIGVASQQVASTPTIPPLKAECLCLFLHAGVAVPDIVYK